MSAVIQSKATELFGEFLGEVNINVGCGLNPIEGFINVDEREWSLGYREAPFKSNFADAVLASHVMEHVSYITDAMREIHRILKPGGHFIAITPYASSDDAVEDPTHVRYFTERSWDYFDRRLYEKPDHAGHYLSQVDFCFDVVRVYLVPYPEFQADPEIEFKKRHWRNVIRELHAVLRKVA